MEKISKEDFERYSDMYFEYLDSMTPEALKEYFVKGMEETERTWQELGTIFFTPVWSYESETLPLRSYKTLAEYPYSVDDYAYDNDSSTLGKAA